MRKGWVLLFQRVKQVCLADVSVTVLWPSSGWSSKGLYSWWQCWITVIRLHAQVCTDANMTKSWVESKFRVQSSRLQPIEIEDYRYVVTLGLRCDSAHPTLRTCLRYDSMGYSAIHVQLVRHHPIDLLCISKHCEPLVPWDRLSCHMTADDVNNFDITVNKVFIYHDTYQLWQDI